MKNRLHLNNVMRSLMLGAAAVTFSCTFTACDSESGDVAEPMAEFQAESQNGAIIAGQYIVVYKDGANLRMSENANYEQRLEMVREVSRNIMAENGISDFKVEQAYGQAIKGVAVKLSANEAETLRKDPRVDYVEPDRIVMLAKPGGGGGGTAGQTVPYGITRVGSASGAGKTAWVIDTGIDLDHPDLNVDAARSVSMFTTGRDAGSADDGNGHGTHVAGTIAAKNNTIGVVGVAYDATVVAVKVLDSRGSGSYSGVIAGVDYVAANAKSGDAANMSLGGPVSQALDDAVVAAAAKGIKFALAAGNESTHAGNSSPARANHNNIYTVSAMDSNDRFASFSNYGNPPVDYCAPGVSINSTWKGGGYNTISGTSMASPHVAGLLLLGNIATDGYVNNDPDGNADPIAHR
ncbi:S8 family serine peptidase [Pontibacter anaerobius]|uniref:S8 family serine peptidase n=1 Tax=Pontibacter anaerobius TaxID=2993940 RepID=A0ABT3RF38_9BACT|nr:S8 family serine peptidase [Pontibacter anaerobius]MCX2740073.1 S8 family serine peptidase [Pontibacter anaerobius]